MSYLCDLCGSVVNKGKKSYLEPRIHRVHRKKDYLGIRIWDLFRDSCLGFRASTAGGVCGFEISTITFDYLAVNNKLIGKLKLPVE